MDVGIKTANDQIQSLTTALRVALVATVGQMVWDSNLNEFFVYLNSTGGTAWQGLGNSIICTSTTRPVTPFEGQVIRETDTNKELTYSGAAWVETNGWNTTTGVTGVNNNIVPPACQVRRTTNLTGYALGTAVTWSSAAYDTNGMFSAGSPTIITIQTTGLYMVTFNGLMTATAPLTRIVGGILKNGAAAAYEDAFGTTVDGYWSMSTIMSLVATDTLGGVATAAGGSAYVIGGAATETQNQSRLSAVYLGRVS